MLGCWKPQYSQTAFSTFLVEWKFTPALTPALSPRRGGIILRLLENSCNRIGRTVIRKIGISQRLFPLPGERIKGEGERRP